MMSIPLGPLALPAAPLLLLLATFLAAWLADRLTRAPANAAAPPASTATAGSVLTRSVLVAVGAARLAHVTLNWKAYGAEPWALIDVRDGGWNAAAGLAAGVGWAAWQAWRHPAWRRALAAGAVAGLALWAAGTASLAALAPRDLPDLVLTDLATGQPVRLREVAARGPVILNLWATWCGPCRREMPVLAASQARHPGVTFLFANQGERAETVHRYLAAQRLGLANVLLDPASGLGPALGSRGLPTTVLFDRDGQRVDAHVGELNGAALEAMLSPVLKP